MRWSIPVDIASWARRPEQLLRSGSEGACGGPFELQVVPGRRWWVVSSPQAVREVFTAPADHLLAGRSNEIMLPIVGATSVLVLDGRAHLRQRKLLLPAFHGRHLQELRDAMRATADAEMRTWSANATIELAPRMQDVTLGVILRAVFGMRPGPRHDAMAAAIKRLVELISRPAMLSVISAIPGPVLSRLGHRGPLARAARPVERLLAEEVADRRRDPRDGVDLLARLLEARDDAGVPLSDVELRDSLVTVLLAGHETTATAMAWTLERLVRHPEALEAARDDPRHLRAAITETLRIRPIAPIVLRRVCKEIEVDGTTLGPGWDVAPCPLLLHRRADLYPDPDAFRPERWLDRTPGTYDWIPFGGGTRRCLGAAFAMTEMEEILSAILRPVTLTVPDPADERPVRRTVTLAPGRGAHVHVRRRNGASA